MKLTHLLTFFTIFLVIILIGSAAEAQGEAKEQMIKIISHSKNTNKIHPAALENITSYIYKQITVEVLTNKENSTIAIYQDNKLLDTFTFNNYTIKNYTLNETTTEILIILNNQTYRYPIIIINDNVNLENYISLRNKNLKYTEDELLEAITRTKMEMLAKISFGFLIGFTIIAIFIIKRLRTEIQPVI